MSTLRSQLESLDLRSAPNHSLVAPLRGGELTTYFQQGIILQIFFPRETQPHQDRHVHTGVSAAKGREGDEGFGASGMEGETESW